MQCSTSNFIVNKNPRVITRTEDRPEKLRNFKVIFSKPYHLCYCIIKVRKFVIFRGRLLSASHTVAFFMFYKSGSIPIQVCFMLLEKRRHSQQSSLDFIAHWSCTQYLPHINGHFAGWQGILGPVCAGKGPYIRCILCCILISISSWSTLYSLFIHQNTPFFPFFINHSVQLLTLILLSSITTILEFALDPHL